MDQDIPADLKRIIMSDIFGLSYNPDNETINLDDYQIHTLLDQAREGDEKARAFLNQGHVQYSLDP